MDVAVSPMEIVSVFLQKILLREHFYVKIQKTAHSQNITWPCAEFNCQKQGPDQSGAIMSGTLTALTGT